MSLVTESVSKEPPLPNVWSSDEDDLPVTVIEPRPGWHIVDVRELWRYRELLVFLAWRDVAIRYKQTILGVGWAVLQPLATMLVFSLFLGKMGGLAKEMPKGFYSLFVLVGVLPWTFFSNGISLAGNSVVTNQNLVTKVYFPRLLIPISAVGGCLFDFAISVVLLAGMMVWYQVVPGWQILLAPLVMLLLIAAAVGVGTLLAALIVAQRDFRYILNFAVQLWMFATPAIYLTEFAPGSLSAWLMPLNPVHGLIDAFRHTILGGKIDWYSFGVSGAVSLALLFLGGLYFRKVERGFADII